MGSDYGTGSGYSIDLEDIIITKGGGQAALSELIRVGLLMAGVRIQPGVYRVSIVRESKAYERAFLGGEVSTELPQVSDGA